MSYILDALKKAERERDIRQVPTLMAEHESGARHWKYPWIVLGALVVCIGAVTWGMFFMHGTATPPTPALTAGEFSRSANEAETMQAQETASSTMSVAKTESASEKSAETPAAPPQPNVPVVPRGLPAAKPIEITRLQQMAERMAAAAQRNQEDEDIPSPEIVGRQPLQMPAPKRSTKPETSAADESQEKPASLKEALNGMTLSVLVFDENKADRMVFINGRKYVEGDLVEDTYLLESITLEGAVLTYRGERALLRPKAK